MVVKKRGKSKLPGTLIVTKDSVSVLRYNDLSKSVKILVVEALRETGYSTSQDDIKNGDLIIPRILHANSPELSRAAVIGKALSSAGVDTDNKKHRRRVVAKRSSMYPEKLNFRKISFKAYRYAVFLEEQTEAIASALEDYETYNVVLDEIQRSADLLKNLDKNQEFFSRRVNGVTTFLPLNQPLYATVCFGVVPALMASDVYLRPPTAMHNTYKKLNQIIDLETHFENLKISYAERGDYVKMRLSTTDVVIFTGQPHNAIALQKQFGNKILFILNGSGHNPLVVTETANVNRAVESTLRVVLYNQGQDCAGPNSILIHQSRLNEFKALLLQKLSDEVKELVGPYQNRENIVGPNTEPKHTLQVAEEFYKNREFCIYGGQINPVTGLIWPSVFEKPLVKGPGLVEFFAPVMLLQPYENDSSLSLYFEDQLYYENAMYVTVFGESSYIKSLIDKGLHTKENILYNTDLHKYERGFNPYGGLGPNASCVFIGGRRIAGATLPQKDIYQYLVVPALRKESEEKT